MNNPNDRHGYFAKQIHPAFFAPPEDNCIYRSEKYAAGKYSAATKPKRYNENSCQEANKENFASARNMFDKSDPFAIRNIENKRTPN